MPSNIEQKYFFLHSLPQKLFVSKSGFFINLPIFQVPMCSFRLRRDSTEYLVMFFTDIILFYLIPLLLSVVLYTLIGKMLLSKSRNKLPGGGTRNSLSATAANKTNQSRVQVSEIYYKVAHTILIQTK